MTEIDCKEVTMSSRDLFAVHLAVPPYTGEKTIAYVVARSLQAALTTASDLAAHGQAFAGHDVISVGRVEAIPEVWVSVA